MNLFSKLSSQKEHPSKQIYFAAFLVLLLFSASHSVAQSDRKVEAKTFLLTNAAQLGLNVAEAKQVRVSDAYTSKGITHYYYQQSYLDLPVYNALMNVVLLPNGKSRVTANQFVSNLPKGAGVDMPTISPQIAIEKAAAHLNLSYKSKANQKSFGEGAIEKGGFVTKYIFDKGDISTEDIVTELLWANDVNQNIHLCWNVLIYETSLQNIWNVRVDAKTGEVIEKNNYVTHCAWGEGESEKVKVKSEKYIDAVYDKIEGELGNLATGDYNVFDAPLESPAYGARTIVNAPWSRAGIGNNATSLQWHNDGSTTYTITRGNNVWAKEDQAADNETTIGASASSPTSDFNFPITSLSATPLLSQDAAITNLFFWNNLNHDIMYQYGFDEVSGNFQNSNQGRGGLGNDYVNADALDGSGTNNANFGTPPDGSKPRMQMFVWNYSSSLSVSATPIGTVTNVGTASFGPQSFNVTGNLVLVNDGVSPNTNACEPIVNNITGQIALIDRGSCSFASKVARAQTAGAIGVIIVQNSTLAPAGMAGDATVPASATTIPVLMISLANGNTLKTALLGGPVSLTMQRTTISTTSDFDNGVITHEYGHGISNRLTGGPSITGCLANAEQMGEGWSDYFALMLTTNWATANKNDTRPIGVYVAGAGIRDFPYTYDMTVSPYNYNFARANTEVHRTGSVWCAMLWDMTWNIIDSVAPAANMYNGTGGNNIALQLVMEGLKLQPCSPGFVDGRDAILLADEILYNGVHKCAIWRAFARRGLGFSASQGSSSSMTDGAQAFDMPPALTVSISSNREYLYTNEAATYTSKVSCGCNGVQSNVIPTITLPTGLTYQSGGTLSGNTISFPSITLAEGGTATQSVTASLNNSVITPTSLFYDGAEGAQMFTATTLAGTMPTFNLNTSAALFENKSWAVGDSAVPSDLALTLNSAIAIPASGNYSLHFNHTYFTESGFDGGVVEFSTNAGATWTDAGALFTQNGYNGLIKATSDNTLAGRQAFTGYSSGKKESIVNISSFNGQSLLVRFRLGTDTGGGGEGWKIDRIWVANDVACLSVSADVMQSNVSQATASVCQKISATPLGFALTCPSDILSCSTNVVTYPAATLVNWEGTNAINYSTPSGSTFASGTTNVTVTATDAVGNAASCNFNVVTGNPTPTISSGANTVSIGACTGSSLTLTSSLAAEYAWFRNGVYTGTYSNTSPNYVIPSVLAGTNQYSVVVIYANGCLSPTSANFTVIGSTPNASISLSGPATFCPSTPTVLNASSGPGYTYSWICGNCASSPNVTASTFTPTASGNHRVVVTQNGCSKSSPWQAITILASPGANAGLDKSVCVNASSIIGVSATTGNTYTWSPSSDLSANNVSNPTVTPSAQGLTTYTLTVTNNSTGCTKTDQVDITGLPLPTTPTLQTSSTLPVCQGTNITLTPTNTTGAVNWYKNGTLFAASTTSAPRVISASSAVQDIYAIRAKNTSACLSPLSNNVPVWIYPAPTPTITATPSAVGAIVNVCPQVGFTTASAVLTTTPASGAPASTYNWQQLVSGVFVNVNPPVSTNSYTATVATTPSSQTSKVFRVQALYNNGCSKNSANMTVKMLQSGCTPTRFGQGETSDLPSTEGLFVYPNPTDALLHISIEGMQSNEGKLLLYNALGQVIMAQNVLLQEGKATEMLDISRFASGVYTLVFQTIEGQKVQKIIKD